MKKAKYLQTLRWFLLSPSSNAVQKFKVTKAKHKTETRNHYRLLTQRNFDLNSWNTFQWWFFISCLFKKNDVTKVVNALHGSSLIKGEDSSLKQGKLHTWLQKKKVTNIFSLPLLFHFSLLHGHKTLVAYFTTCFLIQILMGTFYHEKVRNSFKIWYCIGKWEMGSG